MAGNKEVYKKQMTAGDAAAWEQNWEAAIKAYMGAVREFPNSPQACSNLGYALLQAGQLENALKAYAQAHKLDANDPLPLEKSADVLERLGRTEDASKHYLTVAEIYLGQHNLERAITNWEKATSITSGLVQIHQKLARAYERIGHRKKAIHQYLTMAFYFQQLNRTDIALQATERALRIDSRNAQALNTMTALRGNAPLSSDILKVAEAERQQDDASGAGEKEKPGLSDSFDEDYEIANADERGPIGDAVEAAMEKLAAYVFEQGMMDMAGASAMMAVEQHRAGIREEAITAYKQAEAAKFPYTDPIFLSLGILLLDTDKVDEAVSYFQRVSGDSIMMAGAMHGLSLAYGKQGKWPEAAGGLVKTLRLVDMALAIGEEEQAELASVYSHLSKRVNQTDPHRLEALANRFSTLLTGVDWKRRVAETRNQLANAMSADEVDIIDYATHMEGDVTEAMERISEYIRNRKFILASDEAHHVLEKAPDYLAAHILVAKILMETGLVTQAISKYNLIVQTYLVRGDARRAAEILDRVIKEAPADISLRHTLIELLESQEKWGEVVDHYIGLAETYESLADASNARSTYEKAIELAKEKSQPEEKIIKILHNLAALDRKRIELRGAIKTYEQICEMVDSDTEACYQLVDLNYRLNNSARGLQHLDKLLGIYARKRDIQSILKTLEELKQNYATDMGICSRLAAVYQQTKQVDKAVKLYENLYSLQVDAGMHDEARNTVRRIIALKPSNMEHYQKVLQQLGG